MPATADQLFPEALTLSLDARTELTDRLVASSSEAIAPEIERAHLAEVRRRMARVQAGEVTPTPGEQVLAEGRALQMDETVYLLKSPLNARRILGAIAQLNGVPNPQRDH